MRLVIAWATDGPEASFWGELHDVFGEFVVRNYVVDQANALGFAGRL